MDMHFLQACRHREPYRVCCQDDGFGKLTLFHPLCPSSKAAKTSDAPVLGEGCGRVESKWPACFLLSHTGSKDYALREKCQETGRLPVPIITPKSSQGFPWG